MQLVQKNLDQCATLSCSINRSALCLSVKAMREGFAFRPLKQASDAHKLNGLNFLAGPKEGSLA